MTQYKLFGGFMRPRDEDEDGCDPCVIKPIESTRITYDGPNLPCTGIQTCDDLNTALQKIDQQICNIKSELVEINAILKSLLP